MRSMLSANRRGFVRPSDCNSVNEVPNAKSRFCSKKINKRMDTLANSDSSLKPCKCLIIEHARAGAFVV